MTYEIREADPETRAAELVGLWTDCLGMAGDLESRYRWAYQRNPHGPGRAFLLDWVPGPRQREVVGCSGVLPRVFHQGERRLEAASFVDFAVSADHRTALPAIRLQREATALVRKSFAFGYGMPNRRAAPVNRRIGHREIGSMGTHVRLLRHASALRRVLPKNLPVGACGALLDLAARAMERRPDPICTLEWPSEPDSRFDDLYAAATRSLPLVGDRSADRLRWRFRDMPGSRVAIAALATPSGSLAAYAVVEGSGKAARVKDFLARDSRALGNLLDLLARHLMAAGTESLSIGFFGTRRVTGVLRSHGFLDVAGARRLLGAIGIALPADERAVMVLPGEACPLSAEALGDPESWYLTEGDEDW